MPSSVLVNLTSSNHRWCLFLYNKVTCYINILLCISVLSCYICMHVCTQKPKVDCIHPILDRKTGELVSTELTHLPLICSCVERIFQEWFSLQPFASMILFSNPVFFFLVSPAVTVSFRASTHPLAWIQLLPCILG